MVASMAPSRLRILGLIVLRVPPNLVFEIDDLEAPWLYTPGTFDLIHCRFMFLVIRDYPTMLSQAFRSVTNIRTRWCYMLTKNRTLKSGGHIELGELDFHPVSYDHHFPPNSQVHLWIDLLSAASARMGFNMFIARKFKSLLLDAGFVDVTEEIFEIPWGGWPKDHRLKTIGVWHMGTFNPRC